MCLGARKRHSRARSDSRHWLVRWHFWTTNTSALQKLLRRRDDSIHIARRRVAPISFCQRPVLGWWPGLLLHPQPSDNCRAPVCYFRRTQGCRSLSRQTGRGHWHHFGLCRPASGRLVRRWSAELGVDLPVLIDNTALQVVPDYRLRAGISLQF